MAEKKEEYKSNARSCLHCGRVCRKSTGLRSIRRYYPNSICEELVLEKQHRVQQRNL